MSERGDRGSPTAAAILTRDPLKALLGTGRCLDSLFGVFMRTGGRIGTLDGNQRFSVVGDRKALNLHFVVDQHDLFAVQLPICRDLILADCSVRSDRLKIAVHRPIGVEFISDKADLHLSLKDVDSLLFLRILSVSAKLCFDRFHQSFNLLGKLIKVRLDSSFMHQCQKRFVFFAILVILAKCIFKIVIRIEGVPSPLDFLNTGSKIDLGLGDFKVSAHLASTVFILMLRQRKLYCLDDPGSANLAVFRLGISGLLAGGFHSLDHCNAMTECRDHHRGDLLERLGAIGILKPCAAITNVVLANTCCRAGGRLAVHLFADGMHVLQLLFDHVAAHGTLDAMSRSCFLIIGNVCLIQQLFTAMSTENPMSVFITYKLGRRGVSQRLDLIGDLTERAARTVGGSMSAFGTGGRGHRGNEMMSKCLGLICRVGVSAGAEIYGVSSLGTGGCRNGCRVTVSVSIDLYVSAQNGMTYGAFNARSITDLGTGGRDRIHCHRRMSLCQKDHGRMLGDQHLRLFIQKPLAAGAGIVSHVTAMRTIGSNCCNRRQGVCMCQGRRDYVFTNRTDLCRGLGSGSSGCVRRKRITLSANGTYVTVTLLRSIPAACKGMSLGRNRI